MSKISLAALFWSLLLAIPFLFVALAGTAFYCDHAIQIGELLKTIDQQTSVSGRGWQSEIAQRLPEVAGMIIGQVVLLTILLFSRKTTQVQEG